MSGLDIIDLSLLPAPAVIETLDYEAILTALKADLSARDPTLEAVLELESEPLTKLLEVCAYRETLLRQRVNDAAHAVMVAYATGTDLDQIGANYGVLRLVIIPADPLANPPVVEVLESDTAYRARIVLSLEGYTNAGSVGAYQFHGLSASGQVKGIGVYSTVPGQVDIAVLSHTGTGAAAQTLRDTVAAALNAEAVRPLCDTVVVRSATIVEYTITAALTIYPGAASDPILSAAQSATAAYVAAQHALGRDITRSGLFACLHQPGVQNVTLTAPAADLVIAWDAAGWCTATTITLAGIGE